MSTCEHCWNEAYRQSRLLGGSQVDHYRRLLKVIDGHPHDITTRGEQSAETNESEGSK